MTMKKRMLKLAVFAFAIALCGCAGRGNDDKKRGGYVRKSPDNCRYFSTTTGETYIPVGMNICFPRFIKDPDEALADYEKKFRTLSENGGNYARIWLSHPLFEIEDTKQGEFNPEKIARVDRLFDLADKYGLVPKEVMPETFSSDNTARMAALVSSKLREQGLQLRQMAADKKDAKDIEAAKTRMLGTIYRMLALTIGEPPQSFSYAFKDKEGRTVGQAKTYTPMEFFKEVVGGPINGTFIMAMNDPRRPYYKTYEVEYDRHTYDGHNWKYINLPMDDIEEMAIASLKDGRKLYSSYDVGKFLDSKRGYVDPANFDYASLLGTTFGMDKAARISTYDSGSTHAMTLTAVDLDAEGKATKWKVENSWGAEWSQQRGYLIMSDTWFREYMFRLVVNKKYVPAKILKLSEQEPVMVMPEDPLFAEDK